MSLIEIDGNEGEGGGQVLRAALTLSLITGKAFRLVNVRGKRKPPGLKAQHAMCAKGAAQISKGAVVGAEVGSHVVEFHPGIVESRTHELKIGTAGSTNLLAQCLAFPLALVGGGRLVLEGGTHVSHSPSADYLAQVWAPQLAQFGLPVRVKTVKAGFYPQGGGRLEVEVGAPVATRVASVLERGALRCVKAYSIVSALPGDIGERQLQEIERYARRERVRYEPRSELIEQNHSRGSAVLLVAEFENTRAGFAQLGERGVRAETLSVNCVKDLAALLKGEDCVDAYMGDQILMPAALKAAGLLGFAQDFAFRVAEQSEHLVTHAAVIERFLEVKIVRSDGVVQVKRAT